MIKITCNLYIQENIWYDEYLMFKNSNHCGITLNNFAL